MGRSVMITREKRERGRYTGPEQTRGGVMRYQSDVHQHQCAP